MVNLHQMAIVLAVIFKFDKLKEEVSAPDESQILHVLKILVEKHLWHTSVPATAHRLKIVIIRHIKC